MRDTACVAENLWRDWLSTSTKNLISSSLSFESEEASLKLLKFLAAAHDIGKVSPAFQSKAKGNESGTYIIDRLKSVGLKFPSMYQDVDAISHATLSMLILKRSGFDDTLSIVVGSHHGSSPTRDQLSNRKIMSYEKNTGFKDNLWCSIQDCAAEYAFVIAGTSFEEIKNCVIPVQIQDILTGIIIVADWLASNENFFPLIGIDEVKVDDSDKRSIDGWKAINFPKHAGLVYGKNMSFEEAFGFKTRDFQKKAISMVSEMTAPGIVVIEAPMGEGKTEIALALSEILASKFGQNGLFFGLPTQATANSVFKRVKSWVEKCSGTGKRSLTLLHGKAAYNPEFESIPKSGWNVEDNIVVHEWFHGKTGLLSDISVGTVDQVLMMGLKRKHLSMRHLGISEKVVIIDECHAYDEYMGSYLCKSLNWLGALNVPVILMSATLPPLRKHDLISAYLNSAETYVDDSEGYPKITCVNKDKISIDCADASSRARTVSIKRIDDDHVIEELKCKLSLGGYAGLIVNTVIRAQKLYDSICDSFPNADIHLIHSAFTAGDRAFKEISLMKAMNRSGACTNQTIVIGTQVLEQSLDIDFDVLFTDICPVDLILQRMGRLHRHDNIRSELLRDPTCFIIDSEDNFEKGSEQVYGKYQLMNARYLLGDYVNIPNDIPKLVSFAYSKDGIAVNDCMVEEYELAKMQKNSLMEEKEKRAKVFQIPSPLKMKTLSGWTANERKNLGELQAEATVRDIDGSVEVILLKCMPDGLLKTICDSNQCEMECNLFSGEINNQSIYDSKISLPHRLVARYGVDALVNAVLDISKKVSKNFTDLGLFRDELFVITDENGVFKLMDYSIRYDNMKGLVIDE